MTGKSPLPDRLRDLWHKVYRFLSTDIWRRDSEVRSRPRAFFRHMARLAVLVGQGAREHGCTIRAAALTFITMMGLIPSLAVTLSVINSFAELQQYEERVIDYVVERFVAEMPHDPAADEPDLEERREPFRDRITSFIGEIEYGRIGVAALVFCAGLFYGLLSWIEAAFNNIWGVRRQREVVEKLRTYWTLAVVPPLVAGYVGLISQISGSLEGYPFLVRTIRWLSEVGFVWMVFLALYWLLPNTRVRFAPAAAAALFSAALVQGLVQSTMLATWLFGRRAQTLGELYGTTVAVIPLFVFVIYVLWLIALFGAELAYAGENVENYARDRRTQRLNQAAREAMGINCLLEVAGRFHRGQRPPSTAELAEWGDVSTGLIGDMLDLFERAGLVRSTGAGPEAVWQPARSLEKIGLAEALDCVRRTRGGELTSRQADALDDRLEQMLQEAEMLGREALDETTLAHLATARQQPADGA